MYPVALAVVGAAAIAVGWRVGFASWSAANIAAAAVLGFCGFELIDWLSGRLR